MEKAIMERRLCNAVRAIGRTIRALAGYFPCVGCRAGVLAFAIKSIVPKYTPALIVREWWVSLYYGGWMLGAGGGVLVIFEDRRI